MLATLNSMLVYIYKFTSKIFHASPQHSLAMKDFITGFWACISCLTILASLTNIKSILNHNAFKSIPNHIDFNIIPNHIDLKSIPNQFNSNRFKIHSKWNQNSFHIDKKFIPN